MTKRPVPEQSASAPEELPRRLNTWSTTALVIGLVIGSGIFRTPSVVAQSLDSGLEILAFWVAGGLVTLCLALCLAELATSFPAAGGVYVYLRESWGDGVAFVFGWTILLLGPALSAALALIFADYLGHFVTLGEIGKRSVATAVIVFVTATNYFSLRFAAAIQNTVSTAKAFVLVAIAAAAFALGDGGGYSWTHACAPAPRAGTLTTAFVAVMFTYEGVVGSCAIFGEVENPARSVPRALVGGVMTVVVLYVLVNAAYLYVLPIDQIASSTIVAADVMERILGRGGASVIAGCIVLSTFGTLVGAETVNPRCLFAMARDGLFFRAFGAVHSRHQTPHLATLLCGALAAAYAWLRGFEDLVAQYVLSAWPFLALAVLGPVLKRCRDPHDPRRFSTPGYPFVPAIVIIVGAAVMVAAFIELPNVSLANLVLLALGSLAYGLWKLLRT